MKQFNLYGIGSALLDMVYEVDDNILVALGLKKGTMTLIDEATHTSIVRLLQQYPTTYACGGSAANTIITAQLFGAKNFYSSLVADDTMGHLYYHDITLKGVQTNLTDFNYSQGNSGKCIALITPDKQRTMATYLGITASMDTRVLNERAIAAARYVYIEGHLVAQAITCETALMTREIARKNGTKIALTLSDQNIITLFRKNLESIIDAGVDIIFCNEMEALAYTHAESLAAAARKLQQYAKQFLITLGPKGALAFDGETERLLPEYPTHIVDSLGAGDTFAGAFLSAYTQGMSFFTAADFANLAASYVVAKLGPRLNEKEVALIQADYAKLPHVKELQS